MLPLLPGVPCLSSQLLSEEDEHEGRNEDVGAEQTTQQAPSTELVLAQAVNMHQFVYKKNLSICAKQSRMPTKGVGLPDG